MCYQFYTVFEYCFTNSVSSIKKHQIINDYTSKNNLKKVIN